MKFFTRYNPPPSKATVIVGKSRTKQEFAAECDINNIVSRVGLGMLSMQCPEPVFCDISEVPSSYEEMLSVVHDAQERFLAMPSRVRERFGNDPALLIKFLGDESNYDEALELGLIEPRPVKKSAEEPPAAS